MIPVWTRMSRIFVASRTAMEETHVVCELRISLHIHTIADHVALGGIERDGGRNC
jgi:hypothetical protein